MKYKNFYTDHQTLLFQAAFLNGQAAINAWNQWKILLEQDRLDAEMFSILPFVNEKLADCKIEHNFSDKLKGLSKKIWCENEYLIDKIKTILRALQSVNISTFIPNDIALLFRFYQNNHSRPLNSLDLLIHEKDIKKATEELEKLGWKRKLDLSKKSPFVLLDNPFIAFEDNSKYKVNLWWRLPQKYFSNQSVDNLWSDADLIQIDGLPVYTFNPTDCVLYLATCKTLKSPVVPLIFVADALAILKQNNIEIEWNRLLNNAQNARCTLALKCMLTFLAEKADAPIPTSVLRRLSRTSTFLEKAEYQAIKHPYTIINSSILRLMEYLRCSACNDRKTSVLGFLRYLMQVWNLKNIWQAPLHILFLITKAVRINLLKFFNLWIRILKSFEKKEYGVKIKITSARQPMAIACAADDNYALPLSAMLVSLFSTLNKEVDPHIFIIDSGISSDNKDKIIQSIGSNKQISWCRPDVSSIKDLFISRHISATSYLRLLLPDLVPESFSKIIYLDSDMIIRSDLYKLWSLPIDDDYLIASQDAYYRYLLDKFTDLSGVNLPKNAEYFNAGVLVINLEKWRKEKIGLKILDCAKRYNTFLRHHDQDAMNIVLANKWKKMDARWNQQKFFYSYRLLEHNPMSEKDYYNLINDPYIVHFTGADKPWSNICSQHPFKELFFEYLDMTTWLGWRPRLTKPLWESIKQGGVFNARRST